MDLTELPQAVPVSMTLDEYWDKVRGEGWVEIDTGLNSVVFEKNGVVLKVSVNDFGYDLFLNEALKRQHNPFFPKVFQVARFVTDDNTPVTLVMMEKLTKSEGQANGYSERFVNQAHRKLGWPTWAYVGKARTKHERELVDVLTYLFERVRGSDLHEGNVMMRDEQPVVIDPVAQRYVYKHFLNDDEPMASRYRGIGVVEQN